MLTLQKQLILASGSPRRKELLLGIIKDFRIKVKDTEEDYPDTLEVSKVAAFLAKKKALAFKDEILEGELVLAADTTVILDGSILGKPANFNEAAQMLKSLSGKTHQVITGVCLLDNHKEVTFQDEAKVSFKELTNAEIDYYVSNFSPFDKAGGYGIQEWIGYVGVSKIEGSFYTIMGLPVYKVYEELNKW